MNEINFCKLFFLVQLQISGDNGRGENVKFRLQRKVLCARLVECACRLMAAEVQCYSQQLQSIWLVLRVVWSIHSSQLCSLSLSPGLS